MVITWLSMFADVPAARVGDARTFWAAVSDSRPGAAHGGRGELLPLDPPDGDRYLWLQSVDRDTAGWHLDLTVDQPVPAAERAVAAGAAVLRRSPGLVTLTSPAGQPFCLVEPDGERRVPAASHRPGGYRVRVDQICLDVPAADFEPECRFWSGFTGWPPVDTGGEEFRRLDVPAALPLRILLQRLGGQDGGGGRAHADLGCEDRAAERARHEQLGAVVVGEAADWTTLRDPAGLVYCITDHPTGP